MSKYKEMIVWCTYCEEEFYLEDTGSETEGCPQCGRTIKVEGNDEHNR
jgi:PHP family Zn ribbon phosphoesterase